MHVYACYPWVQVSDVGLLDSLTTAVHIHFLSHCNNTFALVILTGDLCRQRIRCTNNVVCSTRPCVHSFNVLATWCCRLLRVTAAFVLPHNGSRRRCCSSPFSIHVECKKTTTSLCTSKPRQRQTHQMCLIAQQQRSLTGVLPAWYKACDIDPNGPRTFFFFC